MLWTCFPTLYCCELLFQVLDLHAYSLQSWATVIRGNVRYAFKPGAELEPSVLKGSQKPGCLAEP